jgi:hypothetical protein
MNSVFVPFLWIEKITLLGTKSQMMIGEHFAYEVRFYDIDYVLLNTNKGMS